TDPMLRNGLGPLRRQGPPVDPSLAAAPDLVLISHVHRDHLDISSLRRLPAGTPLVVPRGATRWAARGGAQGSPELRGREEAANAGVEVTAVPALHDGHRDRRRGPGAEAVGYLVRDGNRAVYFAGDTDLFQGMSELGSIDLALLPVWGWGTSAGEGHLDPRDAAQAVELRRPRIAVPIHRGTFYPVGLRPLAPPLPTEPPPQLAH